MVTIDKQQAVDRLRHVVTDARADDLVEIYNELFPEAPTTDDAAKRSRSALITKIIAHIDAGLEVEEILDLWNVAFPSHRGVWFDEDTDLIHYNEKVEHVGYVD